jgi:hypothetical protein
MVEEELQNSDLLSCNQRIYFCPMIFMIRQASADLGPRQIGEAPYDIVHGGTVDDQTTTSCAPTRVRLRSYFLQEHRAN